MLCKDTNYTENVSANTRPHQLHRGHGVYVMEMKCEVEHTQVIFYDHHDYTTYLCRKQ